MAKKLKFKSQKQPEKWRIFSCSDVLGGKERIIGPHIEFFGNREIIIEGCLGVFEYSDTYLKLKLPKGSLILCGNSFDISSFEATTISIKGKIDSLEFCV